MTSRSTKSRLPVKCMDGSCKWYVGTIMKPKHGLLMFTSYGGPHSCMPLGMALDGRMMDCNFLTVEFVPTLQKNHTATIDHLRDFIKVKYYNHKLSYYKIRVAKLQRYSRIRKSLTKGWESCSWHTWIKKLAPSTVITPYLGTSSMTQYCAMYFGLSLHALKDSDIVS